MTARAAAMHFGATLRLLRIDAGLSLRGLAQRVGVSSAYLSRVEHGLDAVPTPDRLSAIARALDLPPTLLLELAHQVGPFVGAYLERVPAANALFLDIARRELNGAQLGRVKAFIDREFPAGAEGGTTPLSALLTPARIVLQLSCTELDDVIDLAAARLAPAVPGLGARALAGRIAAREAEASTALGNGVAAPHALVPGAAPAAALVSLARPLQAATPDGAPLRLVVALVHGEGGQGHLQALAQVARLASHDLAGPLCQARDAGDLLNQLTQLEALCR